MRVLYIYLFFIIAVSCTFENSHDNNKSGSIKTTNHIGVDSIVSLNYNRIELFWDLQKQSFIDDESFRLFMNNKVDKHTLLAVVNNITDTTDLKKKICSKKENLVKGDLAFILLYKMGYISPAYDFKMQFDVFDNDNCEFPCELLNYVENNRYRVKNILFRKYFVDKANVDSTGANKME